MDPNIIQQGNGVKIHRFWDDIVYERSLMIQVCNLLLFLKSINTPGIFESTALVEWLVINVHQMLILLNGVTLCLHNKNFFYKTIMYRTLISVLVELIVTFLIIKTYSIDMCAKLKTKLYSKYLRYGFCKKSLCKNATLNSWTLFSSLKGTCSNVS